MRKKILAFTTALALMVPISSMAALLTGTIEYTGNPTYSATSTDLQYADGSPYNPDGRPVLLICIDHSTNMPFGQKTSFNSEAGASAIKGSAGAAGVAAIHWLIDQFYKSYYKEGTEPQQRALQYALWEIGNDYNGRDATSINAYAGASQPGQLENDLTYDPVFRNDPDKARDLIVAYTALYQAMKTTLPNLPRTYRSTTYTLDLFTNQDPQWQNVVAIIDRKPPPVVVPTPNPTPVPTLGQWAVVLLSGLSAAFAFLKLRRA